MARTAASHTGAPVAVPTVYRPYTPPAPESPALVPRTPEVPVQHPWEVWGQVEQQLRRRQQQAQEDLIRAMSTTGARSKP